MGGRSTSSCNSFTYDQVNRVCYLHRRSHGTETSWSVRHEFYVRIVDDDEAMDASIKASLYAVLVASYGKDPDERSSVEQYAMVFFAAYVQRKRREATEVAVRIYDDWIANELSKVHQHASLSALSQLPKAPPSLADIVLGLMAGASLATGVVGTVAGFLLGPGFVQAGAQAAGVAAQVIAEAAAQASARVIAMSATKAAATISEAGSTAYALAKTKFLAGGLSGALKSTSSALSTLISAGPLMIITFAVIVGIHSIMHIIKVEKAKDAAEDLKAELAELKSTDYADIIADLEDEDRASGLLALFLNAVSTEKFTL